MSTKPECEHFKALLPKYAQEELDEQSIRQIELHLASCQACVSAIVANPNLSSIRVLKFLPVPGKSADLLAREIQGRRNTDLHNEQEDRTADSEKAEVENIGEVRKTDLGMRKLIAAGGVQGSEGEATALVNAYIERGLRCLDAGEVERAILDFDDAIRENPNSIPAYLNRALAGKVHGDDLTRKTLLEEARNVWLVAKRDLQRVLELTSPDGSEGIRAKALMIEIQTRLSNQ